jgi:predicted transcriptional regulator of viral defense system
MRSDSQAAISHESALSVYALSGTLPGDIHITFPRTSSRRRSGIKYHTKRITQAEVTSYQGLKVTTVSRTIIDLVESGFDPIQTKMAIDQVIDRGLVIKGELLAQARNNSESIHRTIRFYLEREK